MIVADYLIIESHRKKTHLSVPVCADFKTDCSFVKFGSWGETFDFGAIFSETVGRFLAQEKRASLASPKFSSELKIFILSLTLRREYEPDIDGIL